MKSKREIIALGLFIFGVLWWFGENQYFGWHLTAQTPLEGICDFMVWVFWGLGFFIKPSRVENTKYMVSKATFNLLGTTQIETKNIESKTE